MAKNGMNTKRYSLVFATAVAFCTVCAAGVSTFAWFQANASATVTTSSTSTTITVSKPDDYTLYYYNGNLSSHTYTGTFSSDFTAITNSSDLSTYTTLNAIYPGKIMVFAVTMTSCDTSNYIDLKLTKVTSNTINDQDGSKHRYRRSPQTEVNIGWAIDIYSAAVATASVNGSYNTMVNNPGSLSAQDKFSFAIGTTKAASLAGEISSNVITLSTPIELYRSLATATNMTLFYSVYFSDASTTWFKETNAGGSESYYAPQSNATRYFDQYSSGTNNDKLYNSNCYAGLRFQLNELSLTF